MSTVILLKPGHAAPEEFFAVAIDKNKASLSVAVPETTNVKNHFWDKEFPFMDAIKEYDKVKSVPRLIKLSDDVVPPEEDEKQPLDLIVDDTGKPLVSAVVAGTFSKYEGKDDVTGPEFNFFTQFFYDKVTKVYNESGKDLKKTFDALDTPAFRKELLAEMDDESIIGLISKDGTWLLFQKQNQATMQFPWGVTSNAHGYTEAPPVTHNQPPTEVPKEKPLSEMTYAEKKAFLAKQASGGTKTEDKPVIGESEPTKQVPIQPAKNDQVEYIGTEGAIVGQAGLFPPPGMVGRGLVRWYQRHGLDGVPANLDEKPPISPNRIKANSPFFAKYGADAPTKSSKDVDPKHKGDPAVSDKIVPVLKGQDKDDIVRRNIVPMSEAQFNDPVSKLPPFSKQIETPFEETVLWSLDDLSKLSVRSLMCWGHEVRLHLLEAVPKLKQFKAPDAAKTEEVEKPLSEMTYAEKKAYLAKQKAAA